MFGKGKQDVPPLNEPLYAGHKCQRGEVKKGVLDSLKHLWFFASFNFAYRCEGFLAYQLPKSNLIKIHPLFVCIRL